MSSKKRKQRPYVSLHTHTGHGCLDAYGNLEDFVKKAKEDGQTAFGVTEHGTLRGLYDLQRICDEVGMRAVAGCELYLSPDISQQGVPEDERHRLFTHLKGRERNEAIYQEEVKRGLRERFHLTVHARNQTGLRNLFKLTSKGWTEGFYKRPRVTLELLAAHSKGMIAFTGCAAGAISSAILRGDNKTAKARMDQLHEAFPKRLWVEIMSHPGEMQVTVNQAMLKFARSYDLPVVVTQDAHYVNKTDHVCHDIMCCILMPGRHGTDLIMDPTRFQFPSNDYWLKDRAAIERTFAKHHPYIDEAVIRQALDNTQEIADSCDTRLAVNPGVVYLPEVELPKGMDDYAYLKHLCAQGWQRLGIESYRYRDTARNLGISRDEAKRRYRERLKTELAEFKRQGVVRYMLVVHRIIAEANRRQIAIGPGRGSIGGSLCAYLLGITMVDPIYHDLLFERFLDPSRGLVDGKGSADDMPDIDIDIESDRRAELLDWISDYWGDEYVAQITTIGRLQGKQAIGDVARVLDIPPAVVENVTGALDSGGQWGGKRGEKKGMVAEAVRTIKVVKDYAALYPPAAYYADQVEGHIRQLGVHAAGVVISSVPITDLMPVEVRFPKSKKERPAKVTAFDMDVVAKFGLLKYDFLGLKTLDAIADSMRVIAGNRRYDFSRLNIENPKVLAGFTSGDFTGIFQCDTPAFTNLSRGVVYERFADITAMVALNRPGATRSGGARQYLARKAKPKLRESVHPIYDEITAETYGTICYQEQVQQIFERLAGYSKTEANKVRKIIGKKQGDAAFMEHHDRFIKGAVERGMDRDVAEKLLETIKFAGSYSFNKCLTGDTELVRPTGGRFTKRREITIAELYEGFHGTRRSSPWQIRGPKRGVTVLQVQKDGKIRPGRIIDVTFSGKQRVFVIKTQSGLTIRATANHRFLTPRGYRLVSTLSIGDSVVTMGKRELTKVDKIVSIEKGEIEDTFDVSMAAPNHNFIANGFVSHNSHAAEYALIPYIQMWLRTYYPTEFVYGILRHPRNEDAVGAMIRWARKQGVVIRAADVQSPGSNTWTITQDRAIAGALGNVKGVGPKAVETISSQAPFRDLADYFTRVTGAGRNKLVVRALMTAQAFDSLTPSAPYILENFEEFWKIVLSSRKNLDWMGALAQYLQRADGAPKANSVDVARAAAKVSPVAPYNAVEDHLNRFPTPMGLTSLAEDAIWKQQSAWIACVITGVRYQRVGDFHSGELPSADEQERMGWGRQYCSLNVEDQFGNQARVRMDPDVLDLHRGIVAKGTGTVIYALITIAKKYRMIRVSLAIEPEQIESAVAQYKVFNGSWNAPDGRSIKLPSPLRSGVKFGVVAAPVRMRIKIDKNGGEMAFLDLVDGEHNYGHVLAFASSWCKIKKIAELGKFIKWDLRTDGQVGPDGRTSWFVEGFHSVVRQDR